MHNIILIGGGGHARVVAALLRSQQAMEVIGFTDPNPVASIPGLTHLGADTIIDGYVQQGKCNGIALGLGMMTVEHGNIRAKIVSNLSAMGLAFPSIVSNLANVDSDVTIGDATMVSMGASLVTGSELGLGVIVNTNASIDHACRIGDYCHVAPGSVLCGGVELGVNVIIGAGATIKEGTHIVADTHVGAGAVVIRDILEPGVYVGNPARKISS